MGRLIYSAIASLDGYVEDQEGNFDWSAPDEELHRFVNDLERPVGTYLYGRRMYETMLYWETAHLIPNQSAVVRGAGRRRRRKTLVAVRRTTWSRASRHAAFRSGRGVPQVPAEILTSR
jgi:dihydrofolate reductase